MKKLLLSFVILNLVAPTHAQWTARNLPHNDSSYIFSLQTPDINTVWAHPAGIHSQPNLHVGSGMNYLRTADGGETWTFDSIPHTDTGQGISNIAAIDADTAYVATGSVGTQQGYLYKTTNGGRSWSTCLFSYSVIDNVHFWNAAMGISISDPQGNDFSIKRTSDAGWSWLPVANNSIPNRLTGEMGYCNRYSVAGNHIWFATYGGKVLGNTVDGVRIFHSADRGLHWMAHAIVDSTSTPGQMHIPSGIEDMAFVDSLHGFAVARMGTNNSPALFRTMDGGTNWQELDTVSGYYYAQFLAAVPGTNTIFSSSFGPKQTGSSYSNNLGKSWITVDTGNAFRHSAMCFLNDTLGWGGDYQNNSSSFGGIFKWALAPTVVNNISNLEISISVFPNPAADLVYIKVTQANNLPVQLSITDETGRVVLENTYTGTDNFLLRALNLNTLSRGLYFVNIKAGESRYTQKLIHTF